jgi:surface protein
MSNNPLVENRYQLVLAMKSVARQKGFMNFPTNPAFISATIGSYLPKGKLYRTDEDIHQATQLWCSNPADAEKLYGHISKWYTSNVTNMRKLFECCIQFNDDISKWDVSDVKDMSFMFKGAESFNHDISRWNVSKVTDMHRIFDYALSFNQDIRRWDVSNVKNAWNPFLECPILDKYKPGFPRKRRRDILW